MKTIRKSFIYGIGSLLFLAAALTACHKDSNPTARVEVRMTDAPGDYQAVYVDVEDVQVNSNDGNTSDGWRSLNARKGIYNLMDLTNGLDTLLGDGELPVGKLSQIRLVLGTNNSIVIDDVNIPLATPSAQQSGLKIQIHTDMKEGVLYKILLDFDAALSIVSTGNGGFSLKPVIRSVVEAESGSIKGLISPPAARPAVYALSGQDTVATTFADSVSGHFLLRGVAPGTYTVSFAPKSGYQPVVKENVSVTLGNVSDVGTVVISQ